MSDPDRSRTQHLARAMATERERAKDMLRDEMRGLGLREEDGWNIVEFTRDARGGTEIVLRPLHRQLPSPPGLECIVGIVEEDGTVHARCRRPE